MTSKEFLLSKLPVGSSAKIILGLVIRALPIATLCCSPPDNSFGKCFFLSSSYNNFNNSSKYSWSTFFLDKYRGKVIFSTTLRVGIKL